jgi:hypothetical protein
MSNCDFVAGRSRIDLVASRLPHRALALCAVSALIPPNQSVQRLPQLLAIKEVGPHDVITNHRVERSDDLAHDRNDRKLRQLAGCFEAMVERPQHRIPIARAHRRLVKHVTNWRTTAPDATPSFELATLERIRRDTNQCSDLFAAPIEPRLGDLPSVRAAPWSRFTPTRALAVPRAGTSAPALTRYASRYQVPQGSLKPAPPPEAPFFVPRFDGKYVPGM